MSLHALANDMASKGRYGDSMLVHMSPNEVAGLHALALSHGEKLTINPETGLPEAFSLKKLLPAVLGFALNTFAPGLGTAVGTMFGAGAAAGTAALVGGAYGLAKGSLKEGLMAGLGAYGGAGLAQGLAASGANQIASEEVLRQQAGQLPLEGSSAAENFLSTPSAQATGTTGSTTTIPDATASASPVAEVVIEPVTTTTPMPVAEQAATAGFQGGAGYTPPTGLESLSRGAQSIFDQGRIGDFAKLNKNNLYAIGASAMLSPEEEEQMPETKRDPGYIRPARYDWRTGKYEYYEPVKASEWGTRNLSEYTNPNDPNARTPIGRKAGGLMALANGGAIAFADGGMTEEQLASINAFLQTNPNAEALAAAQAQYGVSNADVERAREYGAMGSAPGSNVPNAPTGPVVGGGGYDPNWNPNDPSMGGTVKQGYSREYTPQEIRAIRAGFLENRDDPQKMMELMTQFGVDVNDISTAMGGDDQGYQNIFLQAGADPSFGGMNSVKNQPTKTDQEYLEWMLTQPNPYGQGTLADVYKKQGIDPRTDPRLVSQARQQNERAGQRAEMYGGTANAPMEQIAPWQDPNWRAKQDAAAKAERERQARILAAQGSNVVVGGGIVGGGGGGGGGGGTTPGPGGGGYTPTPGPSNPQQPVPTTPTIDAATTGGTNPALKYLSGQGKYPVNPYLPIDPATGKPVDVGVPYWKAMGMENPYKGPKVADELTNPNATPKTAAPVGKKWTWNPTDRKWVTEDIITPNPGSNSTEPTSGATGGLMPRRMALGGLGALAGGGSASQYNLGDYSDGGRLLKGPGDGVSDNIPATIGGKQPARLADGEFVVPARIVSELGNGSTDAGARKLYAMMDRVQKARGKTTGKNRVAANSRAEKYLPA